MLEFGIFGGGNVGKTKNSVDESQLVPRRRTRFSQHEVDVFEKELTGQSKFCPHLGSAI